MASWGDVQNVFEGEAGRQIPHITLYLAWWKTWTHHSTNQVTASRLLHRYFSFFCLSVTLSLFTLALPSSSVPFVPAGLNDKPGNIQSGFQPTLSFEDASI